MDNNTPQDGDRFFASNTPPLPNVGSNSHGISGNGSGNGSGTGSRSRTPTVTLRTLPVIPVTEFHRPLGSYLLPEAQELIHKTSSSTLETAPNGNREYVLDHTRDLTLVVGPPQEKCYNIIVSSQILRIASPVWYIMLDPSKSWKESQLKTIPFPDDDPDALLLLLQIAHLKFGAIPRTCSYAVLLKLAILCDKYDVAGLVRPYLDGWVDGVKDTVNSPGHEGWLFISWTFGLANTFTRVAKSLVMSMKRDDRGALVTAEGMPLEEGVLMPVGAIDLINTIREETLHSMETLCLEYIGRFSANNQPVCKNATRHCDATVFGSLVLILRNYFPIMGLPMQPYINLSINDLSEKLNALQVYTFPATYSPGSGYSSRKEYSYYSAHTSCNLGEELKRRLQGILGEVSTPVGEEQVKHMRNQRDKCGSVEIGEV